MDKAAGNANPFVESRKKAMEYYLDRARTAESAEDEELFHAKFEAEKWRAAYEELVQRQAKLISDFAPPAQFILSPSAPDLAAENERLREALRFYANPEVYKPHPHGPAFDNRDISYVARAALNPEDSTT